MGYDGDNIEELISQWEHAVDVAGQKMAEDLGANFQHNITINTPVETYHLRESYDQTAIEYGPVTDDPLGSIRWAAYAWQGTVFTEVTYAEFVEYGTGLWGPKRRKYKIEPKTPGGVLAFQPYARAPHGGVILDVSGSPAKHGTAFARFVMHPGSPGAAMFRIGAVLSENEKEYWSQSGLRLWQQAMDGNLQGIAGARTRGIRFDDVSLGV